MRCWAIAFALGVCWLQQRPELPPYFGLRLAHALAATAAIVLLGVCIRIRVGGSGRPTHRRRSAGLRVLGTGCAFVLGSSHAGLDAYQRLSTRLPAALEGQPLTVVGRVVGLPRGERERVSLWLDVERCMLAGRATSRECVPVPRRISVSWRRFNGDARALPRLRPGQRWRLPVRLQRPHGAANHHGFDFEAWALQLGIDATGHVRVERGAALLADPADAELGWRDRVDRVRQRLASAIMASVGSVAPAALAPAAHRARSAAPLSTGDTPRAHAASATLIERSRGPVLSALTVGDQHGLPAAVRAWLAQTGTSHLLAVSGLHVGIFAGGVAWLSSALWRCGRWRGRPLPLFLPAQMIGAPAAAAGAFFVVALSGFGVPALRAWWMAMVALLAWGLRRRIRSTVTLCWALLLVLVADPFAVLSAGFWLSFCAVAAILLATARSPLTTGATGALDAGGRRRTPATGLHGAAQTAVRVAIRSTRQATRVQLAVSCAMLPLTAAWFAQVSLIGPVANALAIPWVSFVLLPAAMAGVLAPAPLDDLCYRLAARCSDVLLHYLDALTALPLASVTLPPVGPIATAASFAGAVLPWMRWQRADRLRLPTALLCCVPLCIATVSIVRGTIVDGEYRLTAYDIGQGGAILVETARHRLLFDAGMPFATTDAGERIIVPHLRAHAITAVDLLMLSHVHVDHTGGALSVIGNVSVGALSGSLPREHAARLATMRRGGANAFCVQGQHWEWDGVRFDVLWPARPEIGRGDANASSCVVRIDNGRRVALLTGDIEAAQEQQLIARFGSRRWRRPARLRALDARGEAGHQTAEGCEGREGGSTATSRSSGTSGVGLQADVLLAPHHGSRTSSSLPWVRAVDAREVVFQVGHLNRFGHPHPKVIARYARYGARLHRTDRDGAIVFETLGERLRIDRFRDTHRRYWMPAWPLRGRSAR